MAKIAFIFISLAIGIVQTQFIENPFRFHGILRNYGFKFYGLIYLVTFIIVCMTGYLVLSGFISIDHLISKGELIKAILTK